MKSNYLFFILFIGSLFCSCKSDVKTAADNTDTSKLKEMAQIPETGRINDLITLERLKEPIPYPCDLLTADFISQILGVDSGSIVLKEGTPPDAKDQRACFFKWTDPGYPNAGIMIQAMKNPLPDEVDSWVTYYIDSKKSMGEKSMETDEATRFVPYNDLGDTGAASFEAKKFYWQLKDEVVFLIAYNMSSNNDQLREWTKKLGVELMTNYNEL